MCPYLLSFGHTAQAVQPRHHPDLPGAACLVSSADRCSVSSVRACRGMVCPGTCPALVLARPVLLSVLRRPSGCAGGWGLHRRGIQGAPGVGKVSPVSSDQNKKGTFLPTPTPPSQIKTHPIVQVSKNSKKYKKTPFGA